MSLGFANIPYSFADDMAQNKPRCEKTGLRGFRPGPTQTGLYSHRRWFEACNFVFRKYMCRGIVLSV